MLKATNLWHFCCIAILLFVMRTPDDWVIIGQASSHIKCYWGNVVTKTSLNFPRKCGCKKPTRKWKSVGRVKNHVSKVGLLQKWNWKTRRKCRMKTVSRRWRIMCQKWQNGSHSEVATTSFPSTNTGRWSGMGDIKRPHKQTRAKTPNKHPNIRIRKMQHWYN